MKKILIVDDERVVCDHLARMLQRHSIDALACYDGSSAISTFMSFRPDMVFLDLHLPEIKGEAVFDQMHAIDPSAAIYLVSGSQDDIETLKLKAKPFRGYLLKPVMPPDIINLATTP